MTNTPLVTVYIPCRNYGRFLDRALQSLKEQLYTNWELFIIDEASGDETQTVARYFQAHVSQKVEIIHNQTPVGLQKVANRILGLASGRYIVRLDADDWLEESALLLMVAKLESDPKLGLVYGNYYYTDEEGEVIGFERRHRLGDEDSSNHLPPHGACTMVRTNVLKAAGGYSEEINAQDGWELWFKLLQRTQAASLEAPIFYYRQHGNSLSRDSKRLLEARAKIFAKARSQSGNYKPTCLAVIPAKESYPDFEGVPFREIDGKSLLQIAVQAAQESVNVTEVAVTSESDKVLEFTKTLVEKGAIGPLIAERRPQTLSANLLRPREILLHAIDTYRKKHDHRPDIVLFLSLHAPFRRSEHIDKAIDVLLVQACDSVVSVCEEREPMFAHGAEGLRLLNPGRFDGLSYEREKLYRFNGSIIATWLETIEGDTLFGQKIGYIEMGREESAQIKQAENPALIALDPKKTEGE
jgi:glycosyltransferase involved in cell wall biosynthesis